MLPQIAEVADLIVLTAAGDQRAFGRLYVHTFDKLRRTVRLVLPNQLDTEDALQEVYVKVWRHAGSFHRSEYSPISWLVRIARNHALDLVKRKRLATSDLGDHRDLVDPQPSPEVILIMGERRRTMDIALSRLKPKAGAIARDAFVLGLAYDEVAIRHGIPVNTVKTSVRRSMNLFRLEAELAARHAKRGLHASSA
jgi:RNA polymerase sigma-70 factor (ECF subfamily)